MRIQIINGIVFLWAIVEGLLVLTRRSKSDAVSKDRNSLGIVLSILFLATFLGFILKFAAPTCELPFSNLTVGIGLGTFFVGVTIRWLSVFYLGSLFTANVSISHDHHLVNNGPYRIVRHPSYFGCLLAALGFTLFYFQNWASMLITLIPVCAAVLWRIHIEEAALIEAFGERYRNYMRRTRRLIPLIY